MEEYTKVTEARRASVELLLSNHNQNCQQCDKNGKCELLYAAGLTGAREGRCLGSKTPVTVDQLTPAIVRDSSKCILCGRLVACGIRGIWNFCNVHLNVPGHISVQTENLAVSLTALKTPAGSR